MSVKKKKEAFLKIGSICKLHYPPGSVLNDSIVVLTGYAKNEENKRCYGFKVLKYGGRKCLENDEVKAIDSGWLKEFLILIEEGNTLLDLVDTLNI